MLGFLYRRRREAAPPLSSRHNGAMGEDLAHDHLRARGCQVVARNYRTRSGSGEIDLVAWDGGTLVFVEVKTRKTADYGEPDRAVDAEKRARIEIAAQDYARRAKVDWERTRFDIVSILTTPRIRIEWMRDAERLEKQYVINN